MFNQPPVNANNESGNIDSKDENQPTEDESFLSCNQLLGFAVLQINTPSGQVVRKDEEELSNKNEKTENCHPSISGYISGYVDLPRRPFSRENTADVQNIAVPENTQRLFNVDIY